jgi:P4 family phage/plasmid primase-like protien
MQLAPRGEGKEKTPEQREAEKAYAWAQRCRSYSNQRNTLTAASKLMEAGDIDEFDADPWLLNTPGGIVDLRTGDMRDHESRYMCTKITTVAPRLGRSAPKWQEFLRQVTGGDVEFEKYLQMVAGMACVGKVYEEGLVISYGPGSNGKSTLFAVWQELLGSYSGTIRNEVLVGNKNGSEVQGAAQLRGMRLSVTSELEEATRMNLSLLKRLTSRDRISARPLYHDPIEFVPTHTLVLHTNHLPRLSSCDDGTKRRIAIAPFLSVIPPEKKVMDFAGVLVREEGAEILGWMIEGAIAFYKANTKLTKPKVVRDATAEYFAGEDKIGRFIGECCVISPELEQRSGAVFNAFKRWCGENNLYAGRANEFKAELERRGFKYDVRMARVAYVRGLDLNEDYGGL